MVTRKLSLQNDEEALLLLGEGDALLREIEREFKIETFIRHDPHGPQVHVTLRGPNSRVERALRRLKEIQEKAKAGDTSHIHPPSLVPDEALHLPKDAVYVTAYGKVILPKGGHQKSYVDSIRSRDMVFAVGPAGTGKTYLAVACALNALKAKEVSRIVLTRPVVETGEKLGFLPGDLYEKVHPYLKPLYDAFYSMLGPDKFRLWREDEIMEIVPLAYMRGRTLERAFIILDEAQNTTPEQMKMFLTRMGSNSKVVVTGDVTQIDLEAKHKSGLVLVQEILKNVEGVTFCSFTEEDVVRHSLVKKIIRAYDHWEKNRKGA